MNIDDLCVSIKENEDAATILDKMQKAQSDPSISIDNTSLVIVRFAIVSLTQV